MLKVSRGFIAVLGGVGMTVLAWFGWAWLGWPANAAIDLLERFSDFPDLPRFEKSVVVILLIIINVGTWAGLFRLVMLLVPRRGEA
jgi:hypothetical protein